MDLFTLILGKNISGGSSSGGVEYSSIVYNEDNTVTLTEKDGTVHTMACTYEDGKLIGVTYDGEAVDLTYAEDLLLSVSGISVDVNNAPTKCIEPIDHTVTFKVDGETYEVVSVKDGNSINKPINNPTSESGNFSGWKIGENSVTFPYLPTDDTEINAYFSMLSKMLYNHFSVNESTYPYITIDISETFVWLNFSSNATQGDGQISFSQSIGTSGSCSISDKSNGENVVTAIINTFNSNSLEVSDLSKRSGYNSSYICWCNHEFTTKATFYLLS